MGTVINIGGGFTSGLTLLFIALKLLHKIDWSWWWVLSPMWISVGLLIGIILIALTILGLKEVFN